MVLEVNVRSKIRSWSFWTTPLCFCCLRKTVRGPSPAGNYLWSGRSGYIRVWHKPGRKTQRLSSLSQTLPCQPGPWTSAWEGDPEHSSAVSFPAWDTGNQKIKSKEKFNQMMWNALWNLKHTLLALLILSFEPLSLWALQHTSVECCWPSAPHNSSWPSRGVLTENSAAAQRQYLQLLLHQAH